MPSAIVSARALRAAGRPVAVDGFSRPYVAAVAYGSAVYGFLAVLLSIGAARRLLSPEEGSPDLTASAKATARLAEARFARRRKVGPRAAVTPNVRAASIGGGVLAWAGTPLLFYMYVAPPMSHACSAFAVALFVAVWLHARRTWSAPRVVALGLAAALMAMVREQDVFFVVGPALDFLLTHADGRDRVRAVGAAAAGCVAFAIGFLPQLVAYQRLNGHMRPSPLVTRKMTWSAPHAVEVLFSPAHGYVWWTPLAVLGLAGLVLLAVSRRGDVRRVAILALVMVLVQVYVGGSVESWSVAGAFGQRRFVALTIFLAIGMTALWEAAVAAGRRAPLAIVVALCVWWNLALTAALRHRAHGSQAARSQAERLRRLRHDPAHGAAARVSLSRGSGLVLSQRAPGADPLTSRAHPLPRRHPLSARARQRDPVDGNVPRPRAPRARRAHGRAPGHRSSRRVTRTCSTACRDSIG